MRRLLAAALSTTEAAVFDAAAPWARSTKIGLRPEPFGALAYHFDTRRLVFLKSNKLVDLVDGLTDHDSANDAIEAIIAPANDRSRSAHVKALESLAEAGVIEPRPADPASATAPPTIGFVG